MFKYKKGLVKESLLTWKERQWYHQRFDGAPYFMSFVCDAEILYNPKRKFGADFDVHYVFYEDSISDWYIAMSDIEKVTKIIFEKGRENFNLSNKFIKLWLKDKKEFYKKIKLLDTLDFSKLSNDELMKLHDSLADLFCRSISCSSIIDGFALGTDELLSEKLKTPFEKSNLKDEMRFSEFFSTLTSPLHLSFLNQAELELLKVAIKAKKNSKLKNKLLKKVRDKFFWIKNNYVNPINLSVENFNQELNKIINSGINIKKELSRLKSIPKKNKKTQKELLNKINANKELKFFLKFTNDLTYWQDERKKGLLLAVHYFDLFLEEISKRVKVNHDLLKYLTLDEVKNIFKNIPNKTNLNKRKKYSVYYWDKTGFDIAVDKEAKLIKKELLEEKEIDKIDDFRGLSAATGKVKGRVKILKSAKYISKVKKGDILVTVMTRPDYLPAIKKAAAIVTDEGGITSHAAIIARELGVPCIIGTKIATKTLKDNQLVEVNANHGWVKILRENKNEK